MFEKSKKRYTGIAIQMISFLVIMAFAVSILFFIPSLKKTSGRIREESIEATIREYAVRCYATEGSYPPSLDYLALNYGLIIDDEHYVYYFDAFAANYMPDIEVYSKRKRK
jgi:competence protein ComGC